jgi:hypothetical protein
LEVIEVKSVLKGLLFAAVVVMQIGSPLIVVEAPVCFAAGGQCDDEITTCKEPRDQLRERDCLCVFCEKGKKTEHKICTKNLKELQRVLDRDKS